MAGEFGPGICGTLQALLKVLSLKNVKLLRYFHSTGYDGISQGQVLF